MVGAREWKLVGVSFPLFLWAACLGSDLYSNNVQKYDSDDFKRNVGKERPHFVNFFAPWCGYCKRLKPVWDELAEKYNVIPADQKVVIVKVDCTIETPLCAEQLVSGYPSLVFYNIGSTEGIKYKGKREIVALEEFIGVNIGGLEDNPFVPPPEEAGQLPPGALELTDEDFRAKIGLGMNFVKFYAPWCGHCQRLAPLWDDLARATDNGVAIAKIDCTTNNLICSEFEVKAYPTLIFIFNGKKVDKFQGERTVENLKRFMSEMKLSVRKQPEIIGDRVPEQQKSTSGLVVELTADNFENAVSKGVSFVKFFAPWCGHCRRLAPTWDNLAEKFLGETYVRVAKVDCTTDNELCNEQKVQGYPTLVMFKNGQRLSEYSGLRDLESLHTFVIEQMQKKDEL